MPRGWGEGATPMADDGANGARVSGGKVGSRFDAFLDEQGIRAEVESRAVEEIIADQTAVVIGKESDQ